MLTSDPYRKRHKLWPYVTGGIVAVSGAAYVMLGVMSDFRTIAPAWWQDLLNAVFGAVSTFPDRGRKWVEHDRLMQLTSALTVTLGLLLTFRKKIEQRWQTRVLRSE